MVAQFFQSPMLLDFLEQFKENINVGYIFLNQNVFIKICKKTNEYFFVYLLLWFYLHLIDYTDNCIISLASAISFQYFLIIYHCLL